MRRPISVTILILIVYFSQATPFVSLFTKIWLNKCVFLVCYGFCALTIECLNVLWFYSVLNVRARLPSHLNAPLLVRNLLNLKSEMPCFLRSSFMCALNILPYQNFGFLRQVFAFARFNLARFVVWGVVRILHFLFMAVFCFFWLLFRV